MTNKPHRSVYTVRRCGWNPRKWGIFNLLTGEQHEGGFFSKDRAWEYLDKEYDLTRV